jgi:hypothetical protein
VIRESNAIGVWTNYLWQLIRINIKWQLEINTTKGFLRMFISFDYIHYRWKNCPIIWQFEFIDKDKNVSIFLEVLVDKILWFWHAHFSLPGDNNDLNVLDRFPLISNSLCVHVLNLNSKWMGITTQGITFLFMAYIFNDQVLCKLCTNRKVRNKNISFNDKR